MTWCTVDRIAIAKASKREIAHVAKHLREADRHEIDALAMLTPERAMELTVARSLVTLCGRWDGKIACVFGIARQSSLSDIGVPWLLGTELVREVGPQFLWRSRWYVQQMAEAFPKQENYVHANNTHAVDWLRWLGFDMDDPAPYGVKGESFIRFSRGMR